MLGVAREAIAHGATTGCALPIEPDTYAEELRVPRGVFVTLHLEGALRGCVGSLRPRGPLVAEVARSAHMAAFRDPRFPPVTLGEVERLAVHISVLSVPERLHVDSERALVEALRPGVDGVILQEGSHLGTFLPDVWASIPEAAEFVRELKRKAGLGRDYWSSGVSVERYTTEAFG